MKDLTITKRRIWIEIAWLIAMFLLAEGLNFYAIIKHQTQWRELWTQLPFILILTLVFYALVTALRIFIWGFTRVSKYLVTR